MGLKSRTLGTPAHHGPWSTQSPASSLRGDVGKSSCILQGRQGLDAVGSDAGHPPSSSSVTNPRIQGLNELHLPTRSVIADLSVHDATYARHFYTLPSAPLKLQTHLTASSVSHSACLTDPPPHLFLPPAQVRNQATLLRLLPVGSIANVS